MAQSSIQIWIHCVWAVKNRTPELSGEFRASVLDHMQAYAREERIILDTINAIEDHVHCLFILNTRCALCDIVGRLKGESSYWINDQRLTQTPFSWQEGYTAHSVSPLQAESVRRYIREQERYHREYNLKQEIEMMVAEDWGRLMEGKNEKGKPSNSTQIRR